MRPARTGPTEIRVALLRRGLTVTALARRLGCSRPAASRAVHGRACPGLRRRILAYLGLK